MKLFSGQHITASFVRGGVRAIVLDDVCFELEEGRIYDLTGPSGSGKSTLLRVCARMMERSAGTLALAGRSSDDFSPTAWRRQVCLVPQRSALISATVRENMVLPWKLKVNAAETAPSDDVLRDLLDAADLGDVELERDASQLSGGQAARVALLRAFATRPRILLLDEVDAALDQASADAVGALVERGIESGAACLRVRHRPPDGRACGAFRLEAGSLTFAARERTVRAEGQDGDSEAMG